MDWITFTADMRRQGIRRVLVISGDTEWCEQQKRRWVSRLAGDWICVSDTWSEGPHCSPAAHRNLLGREFRHGIFDARQGFHAEAFAALAGTLMAGSWLLLMVPSWASWPAMIDNDSLRWNDRAEAVATPNFIRHLQFQLSQDAHVVIQRQHHALHLRPLAVRPDWQADNTRCQHQLLQRLLAAPEGVSVLTALRGCGKSTLAGMLARAWPGKCRVTAPGRIAVSVLAHYAGEAFHFFAPDALLAECEKQRPHQTEWLLIDEAAAMPSPLLQRLTSYFSRVLLTTTVQGYEGTGRGFLLKFCASLPDVQYYTLDQPLRWAADDPVEQLVNRCLLLTEDRLPSPSADDPPQQRVDRRLSPEAGSLPDSAGKCSFQRLTQAAWQTTPQRMIAICHLLNCAHYRTSPLDLRRMMDASGMHFSVAYCQQQMCAALWLVDEGGLSDELATAVWAGMRRPRGNLVAQSLAAHTSFSDAARLRSQRITRIAVAPAQRERGIGRELIMQSIADAAGRDFFSVSFGYTEALWHFWRACGFQLVRIGTQREASSGCYTAMALLPLSSAGKQLTQCAVKQLARDYFWLQPWLEQPIALAPSLQQHIDSADWREIAGFAFAYRSFYAALPALGRLQLHSSLPLPALRGAIVQRQSAKELCSKLGISDRKALLLRWRQEASQALEECDARLTRRWREQLRVITGRAE